VVRAPLRVKKQSVPRNRQKTIASDKRLLGSSSLETGDRHVGVLREIAPDATRGGHPTHTRNKPVKTSSPGVGTRQQPAGQNEKKLVVIHTGIPKLIKNKKWANRERMWGVMNAGEKKKALHGKNERKK